MNKRQKKARVKRCGFYHYDKELVRKLKKGWVFPWVSEQGPSPIPLCKPGDCLICRFCSDIFLDWHGPYGVSCRFNRDVNNCKSFMLDNDQPLFHPDDHKSIDKYIAEIRGYDKNDSVGMSIKKTDNISDIMTEFNTGLFDRLNEVFSKDSYDTKDESILDYLNETVRESVNNIGVPPELIFGPNEFLKEENNNE